MTDYKVNQEVNVFHWIGHGTGLLRRVFWGTAITTGRQKFEDDAVFWEIDTQDGEEPLWIHENNLEPYRVYEETPLKGDIDYGNNSNGF